MSSSIVPAITQAENGKVLKPVQWRDPIVSAIMTALSILMTCMSSGNSRVSFIGATSWFTLGEVTIPALFTGIILSSCSLIATAVIWIRARQRRESNGWLVTIVGASFVLVFLIWTVAGKESSVLPVVSLLSGGLLFATPLVYGALTGIICERTGVINIAIEGQLLLGAFFAVVAASLGGNPLYGLIAAPIAGMLVSVLLALFTIKFRADHIVVGVVLNMLVVGLTSFMFSTQLKNAPELNQALPLPTMPIPVLKDIPIIGPVLFNQTLLVYLMYVAVIAVQIALFSSRWGLRTRACGEHPKAADTVGIRVNALRWKNVIMAGAIAGLGGAVFTVGEGLAFSKNIAAGNGFIALAAMILGRWNPKGAFAAALLFGFATNLGAIMQAVNAPIPAEFLLMIPYVVTIFAVAGFVGAVRAPAAEGVPYP
ncbi:ABC transporter permease [Schaalia sp. lx-100]|uniref:ABC transporter permease n=1 Tax=Schaalia sp. lx-100 TaxID=2899081 RepID=UPI001E51AEDE|nr:ABC transporter permease [Schaalia sp. lx-100]MCD4557250.1 ABC transporter permease [Schaalia sp. lx-100]